MPKKTTPNPATPPSQSQPPDPKPPTEGKSGEKPPENAKEGEGQTPTETPEVRDETIGIDQFMHAMDFGPAPEETKVAEGATQENATTTPPEAKKEPSGEEPAPEKAGDEEPEPEKEGQEEEEEPPKPKKKGKKEPEPEIDPDALHESIRETVREAISSTKTPPETPADPAARKDSGPTLSPSRRQTLEAAQFMEQNMDQYRGTGLAGQFQRYWKAEDDYKAKWLAENKGERYRADDEAHNDFYARNPVPDYDPGDLEDARVLRTEQAQKEREDAHRAELARVKYEAQSKHVEEEIKQVAADSVVDIYVNTSPAVKEALTVDGQIVYNKDTLEKLEAQEPVLAERLSHHSERAGVIVRELEKLTKFPDQVKFDPTYKVKLSNNEHFYPHQELVEFVDMVEKALLSKPPAETKVGNRMFLTGDDYNARSKAITQNPNLPTAEKQRALKALADKYYYLDSELIKAHQINYRAWQARTEAQQIEERLAKSQKFGGKSNHQSTGGAASGQANNAGNKQSDGRGVRPPSPSLSTSDKTNAGGADPKNITDRNVAIDQAMGW